jgi:hypothetical protein
MPIRRLAVAVLVLLMGVLSPLASWAQLPSVTSAYPDPVQLVVGGAPVTVTLSGARLDGNWSLRVLLADTPVSPVAAEIGPAIGAVGRTIVLRAGPEAPVGNYVVQIVVGSRAVPIPLSVRVVRKASAPAPSPG